jgi:predicted phosphate transport protein (TIGR00153 family)
MLSIISLNLEEAAKFFVESKIKNEADLHEFSQKMKGYERKGDSYVHELIIALNKTFVTPLQREDILELAMKMDDVLDGFEEWSNRLEIYGIPHADEYMVEFVGFLYESSKEIAQAITLMSKKNISGIRNSVIKINDYETECDDLLVKCITNLFKNEKDAIKIIQYKELYEMLESVADSCEDVADTLETIMMRNA